MNDTARLMKTVDKLKRDMERQAAQEGGEIAVRYSTAAAQSIPHNSATIINYETASFDPDSLVTAGTAWAFTAPVGGVYAVSAMATYGQTTTWADGEFGLIELRVNGTIASRLDLKNLGSGSAIYMALEGSDLVSLASGDTVDIRTQQTSGSALALLNSAAYNHVAIWKI